MTTVTLRLPDGAVYVTEQEQEQPVSKSAVTPSEQRELARMGATAMQEKVAKARLAEALESEIARLSAEYTGMYGQHPLKDITRDKIARHRARLAELTTGAPQTIAIDRKAAR
jgi:hypothetical protein